MGVNKREDGVDKKHARVSTKLNIVARLLVFVHWLRSILCVRICLVEVCVQVQGVESRFCERVVIVAQN